MAQYSDDEMKDAKRLYGLTQVAMEVIADKLEISKMPPNEQCALLMSIAAASIASVNVATSDRRKLDDLMGEMRSGVDVWAGLLTKRRDRLLKIQNATEAMQAAIRAVGGAPK